MIRKRFPVLAFALLTVPAALHAQSVSGRVVDRATDRPIPATSVVAENGSGRVIGQVLADSAGRFTVALRGAGRYRLRADRIGYQPVTSAEFDVSSAEALAVDLHLSAGAVELDPPPSPAAPRRRTFRGWSGPASTSGSAPPRVSSCAAKKSSAKVAPACPSC